MGGQLEKIPRKSRARAARTRIEDVAALAKLSTITVSRALRQPGKVAPETRARIMEAVEALGYIPNLAASSLASHRSGIVAVIVPTLSNSIFAATVQGLSDLVAEHGYQLLVGETGYSADLERSLIAACIGRQPDAIAYIGVLPEGAARDLLASSRIPVVETWDLTPEPLDLLVGFSNYEAGRAMTHLLLERGCERVAFVARLDARSAARRQGYRDALAKAGRTPCEEILLDPQITYGAGARALAALVERQPSIDSVFFATDVLAIGGLLECRRGGIEIPRQLAIAGLGDLELSGEFIPALTTLRVPSYEMGRKAAELLLARVAGETVATPVVDLGFEIIERETTPAAARARSPREPVDD
jgi:LacI family gluconate utilization system Gnt-I transcriptional repressor